MPSSWGRRHGLPGYDEFRLNMAFRDAYEHLKVSKKHRYKRRGSVLGYMHEMKLELYEHAVDQGYLETLKGGRDANAKPKDGAARRLRREKRRAAAASHSAPDHGAARADTHHTGSAVVRGLAHSRRGGSRGAADVPLQEGAGAPDRPRRHTGSGGKTAERR